MLGRAEETRRETMELYQRACEHSDRTIGTLDLDHPGTVAAWPQHRRAVTLHQILVHMLVETTRHAGHADIVRELIDHHAGLRPISRGFPKSMPTTR